MSESRKGVITRSKEQVVVCTREVTSGGGDLHGGIRNSKVYRMSPRFLA